MTTSVPRPADDSPDPLAARREHQRRRALALSPAEHLAKMDALNSSAWRLLESNPAAMQAFVRPNHRNRSMSIADALDLASE